MNRGNWTGMFILDSTAFNCFSDCGVIFLLVSEIGQRKRIMRMLFEH
jgi:hypothetical protein